MLLFERPDNNACRLGGVPASIFCVLSTLHRLRSGRLPRSGCSAQSMREVHAAPLQLIWTQLWLHKVKASQVSIIRVRDHYSDPAVHPRRRLACRPSKGCRGSQCSMGFAENVPGDRCLYVQAGGTAVPIFNCAICLDYIGCGIAGPVLARSQR
jgi:hypothetical protein